MSFDNLHEIKKSNLNMYELWDTFNNNLISRHRTMFRVGEAEKKFHRKCKRNGPKNSHITTKIFGPNKSELNSSQKRILWAFQSS